MHADLAKLLDLQAKDSAVAEVERRLGALRAETGVLDQALDKAREGPVVDGVLAADDAGDDVAVDCRAPNSTHQRDGSGELQKHGYLLRAAQ